MKTYEELVVWCDLIEPKLSAVYEESGRGSIIHEACTLLSLLRNWKHLYSRKEFVKSDEVLNRLEYTLERSEKFLKSLTVDYTLQADYSGNFDPY